MAVSPEVRVGGSDGTRMLVAGGTVHSGDIVETGPAGQAQLLFDDGTRIAVGPQSRLVVEEVLFRSAGRAERFVVGARRGTFRFLSGESERTAYEIRTPTGTLGIRGTAFDIAADGDRQMHLALLQGEVRLCATGSRTCVTARGSCALVTADRRGRFTVPETSDEVRALIEQRFPYILQQARLRPEYRVDPEICGDSSPPVLRRAEGAPARTAEDGPSDFALAVPPGPPPAPIALPVAAGAELPAPPPPAPVPPAPVPQPPVEQPPVEEPPEEDPPGEEPPVEASPEAAARVEPPPDAGPTTPSPGFTPPGQGGTTPGPNNPTPGQGGQVPGLGGNNPPGQS